MWSGAPSPSGGGCCRLNNELLRLGAGRRRFSREVMEELSFGGRFNYTLIPLALGGDDKKTQHEGEQNNSGEKHRKMHLSQAGEIYALVIQHLFSSFLGDLCRLPLGSPTIAPPPRMLFREM